MAYYILKLYSDENDQINLDSVTSGVFPGKGLKFNNDNHPELNIDNIIVLILTKKEGAW